MVQDKYAPSSIQYNNRAQQQQFQYIAVDRSSTDTSINTTTSNDLPYHSKLLGKPSDVKQLKFIQHVVIFAELE